MNSNTREARGQCIYNARCLYLIWISAYSGKNKALLQPRGYALKRSTLSNTTYSEKSGHSHLKLGTQNKWLFLTTISFSLYKLPTYKNKDKTTPPRHAGVKINCENKFRNICKVMSSIENRAALPWENVTSLQSRVWIGSSKYSTGDTLNREGKAKHRTANHSGSTVRTAHRVRQDSREIIWNCIIKASFIMHVPKELNIKFHNLKSGTPQLCHSNEVLLVWAFPCISKMQNENTRNPNVSLCLQQGYNLMTDHRPLLLGLTE